MTRSGFAEASAATFRKRGGSAKTNPGSEKNIEVNGYYPDVVAMTHDGQKVIEEIETESTVSESECDNQWKPYSLLGYRFHLVVPTDKMGVAQRILRRQGIQAIVQGYNIENGKVLFSNL